MINISIEYTSSITLYSVCVEDISCNVILP